MKHSKGAMEVSGTVKPGTASPPQAAFQLNFKSFPVVMPSMWVCDIGGIPYTSDYPETDGGFFLDNIEIAAMDGAQVNGQASGTTLETIRGLQIHMQAAP